MKSSRVLILSSKEYILNTMQAKRFQKKIEDFICEHCGAKTKGSGYTNHCAECLWSKHLDVNPGDRMAICRGMMEPISIEVKRKEYIITYRCRSCNQTRVNKSAPEDNVEELIRLSSEPTKKKQKR